MKVIEIAENSQPGSQEAAGDAALADTCNMLGNCSISEVELFLDSLKVTRRITTHLGFG